jgi:hypothetical protein
MKDPARPVAAAKVPTLAKRAKVDRQGGNYARRQRGEHTDECHARGMFRIVARRPFPSSKINFSRDRELGDKSDT